MSEHEYSAKWRVHQRQAEQAWEKILRFVKKKRKFDHSDGWKTSLVFFSLSVDVVKQYGYCFEFQKEVGTELGTCDNCPLYQDAFCFAQQCDNNVNVLWTFIRTMRQADPDWELAERLASRMLERIRQDSPAAQAGSPFARAVGESS